MQNEKRSNFGNKKKLIYAGGRNKIKTQSKKKAGVAGENET
jgi:hypothetical protein